jgi:hypothetical protein
VLLSSRPCLCVFLFLTVAFCFLFFFRSSPFFSFYALSFCVFPPSLGQQPRLLYNLYTALFRKQILH